MRIGISTLIVRPGRSGSNEPYLVNLVDALLRLDNENEYVLFVTRKNRRLFERSNDERLRFVELPASFCPFRILCDQFVIPFWAKTNRIEVLHFPGTVGSITPLKNPKMVITVHYDIDEMHASSIHWIKLTYFKLLFRLSIQNASILIVPSQSFYRSLSKRWQISEKKLLTVYHGVNIYELDHLLPFKAVQKKYGICKKYLLSVTNSLPHKNLSGLLEAFAILRQQMHDEIQLVLVGNIDKSVLHFITESIIQKGLDVPMKDIICTGFIPHLEVLSLCKYAFAMLNPTLVESSSMTMLEAAACGLPVIASDIPVHREILGNAAILVEPWDSAGMANACLQLFKDEEMRMGLSEKGMERACEFSWERAAKQTIEAYKLARKVGEVCNNEGKSLYIEG